MAYPYVTRNSTFTETWTWRAAGGPTGRLQYWEVGWYNGAFGTFPPPILESGTGRYWVTFNGTMITVYVPPTATAPDDPDQPNINVTWEDTIGTGSLYQCCCFQIVDPVPIPPPPPTPCPDPCQCPPDASSAAGINITGNLSVRG